MDLNQFFYEHPVFRHEEFANWKTQRSPIKNSSINTALRYHLLAGHIKSIRRNLYAVVPPNQSAETFMVDPYLIAGKATKDAVISYHTALEMMGAAYSTFSQFTYLTEQKSKSFDFQGQRFQSASVPTALQKNRNAMICIDLIDRHGVMLRITNPARTFVDVLDRISLCGGWEEVCRSLANLIVLDVNEVINYCLMLENACLSAKVGYFLSQRKGAFTVSEKQLKPLLAVKPKIPQYTSKRDLEPFQLVKRWNILLPSSVIYQSWEEPHVDI